MCLAFVPGESTMFLVPIFVIGFLVWGIVSLVKLFTAYFLKKKLIEKDLIGEDAKELLKHEESISNKYSSLKWGILTLFGGIGFIIVSSMGMSFTYFDFSHTGILLVAVALGFLTYYMIVKNKED